MQESHRSRIELFVSNTQRMKKGFAWQDTLLRRMAALFYTAEDREIDPDAVRACHELIKKSTGLFSTFRGNAALGIATQLSLSGNREARLSDTLAVYDRMKKAGFRASDFLALAAYQIAAHAETGRHPEAVQRAKAFYDGMKKLHPFVTGRDDYIFAAMLGLSDIEVAAGLSRMEQLYAVLKPEFRSGNRVQAVTQVLVLAGKAGEAATRLFRLRDAFRERGIRLDTGYGASSLAMLSLLSSDGNEIVGEVSETFAFLRGQKGFGRWSIAKQELMIFSAALVASGHANDAGNVLTAAVSTSITNIVIAQQAALMAALAASSAAAATASNG